MIKAGIIGATGYAGGELVRILYGHKEVEITWLYSRSYEGQIYSDIYRNMFQMVDLPCLAEDLSKLADRVDVIFTATPQGYLQGLLTEELLQKARFIDLSADYRIKDVDTYESWYKMEHKSPQLIEKAVYGLCEKNRETIKGCRLLANPGCYPTCSFLSIAPAVKAHLIDPNTIIIDAKSGTTGAGRGAKVANLYCEVNENIKAYGLPGHRHTPEIEEQLSYLAEEEVMINFSPHLVPMNRGILVTAYASLLPKADGSYPTEDEVHEIYEKAYEKEAFVRVLKKGVFPETRFVEGSNFTDVNIVVDERTHRLIMMGALDNIVKGAAGQAVQNMNIMFGLEETEGLLQPPVFP
jgi:N-acetyl-gamma-glutamyl-phosphate reductase